MTEQRTLTRAGLKTPRAAAIAGMLFSVLLIIVFWLLRSAVPADPQEPGSWLNSESGKIALALNLVPFAGIAFLWFIGVLRDRLGEDEDGPEEEAQADQAANVRIGPFAELLVGETDEDRHQGLAEGVEALGRVVDVGHPQGPLVAVARVVEAARRGAG